MKSKKAKVSRRHVAFLNASAEECGVSAVAELRGAAEAIEMGRDTGDIVELVMAAVLLLGEARGYRNAVCDLIESGEAE